MKSNLESHPMNTNGKVIPHRFYRHPDGGQSVSLFTSYVPPGFVLVTEGFTIEWIDGTTGCGRKAFATEAEGNAYLERCPAGMRGMSAMGN
jgi:hypothetical protein